MTGLAGWEKALIWTAFAKVALGVIVYLAGALASPMGIGARTHLMAAHVLVYGVAAFALTRAGSRDPRAVLWGVILLLVAEAFVDPTLEGSALAIPWGGSWFGTVGILQASALSPYFLWRFVHEFPRVTWFGIPAFTLRTFIRVSAAFGLVFLGVNAVGHVLVEPDRVADLLSGTEPGGPLWALMRENDEGVYWPISYAVSLMAAVALLLKLPAARREEKRRAWLLVTGCLVGTVPSSLWTLATSFSPSVAELLPLRVAGWVIYPSLLSPPLLTGYAVVVHRALDVRLIARSALRFTMTRYTLTTLALVPLGALVVSVYRSRERSLTELLADARGALLMLLAAAGLAGVRFRRAILDFVDRWLFREVYEARRILRGLVDDSRVASTAAELAGTIASGVSRAFAPETSHVFLRSESGAFDSPQRSHRSLPAHSTIPSLLETGSGVVRIDLSRRGSRVRDLPEEDRFWMADGGVRLLVPMRETDGRVVGFMALGDKASELPYTREDVELLAAVASTAVVALGFMRLHGTGPPPSVDVAAAEEHTEPAGECPACGLVEARAGVGCGACGTALVPAPVPLVLANKFRLAQRLGAGGMGVVYRALDLGLGRAVAVKTLPRTTPGHAARLRHEARAMASVSHPNLALIFGGESWRGVPMLVFEYLPGGTLADRLRTGPLPCEEVISLGVALADAVRAIHKAGILHRDIKPSNIGFTEDGAPKLLDFGLARILGGARTMSGANVDDIHGPPFPTALSDWRTDLTVTRDQDILGTPLYLSPEAIDGGAPDPHMDLWALALTLYEAAVGSNPVRERTLALTLLHIVERKVPDLRELAPSADPGLAAFFDSALSLDRKERPRTAGELAATLASLRASRAA